MLSVTYTTGYVIKRNFTDLTRGLKIKKCLGGARRKGRTCGVPVSHSVFFFFFSSRKKKEPPKPNPYTQYQIKHHIFHKLNRCLGKQPTGEFSTCASFTASFKPTVKQQGHICTSLPFLLCSYDTLSYLKWYSYFISSPNFGSLFIMYSGFFFFFFP